MSWHDCANYINELGTQCQWHDCANYINELGTQCHGMTVLITLMSWGHNVMA